VNHTSFRTYGVPYQLIEVDISDYKYTSQSGFFLMAAGGSMPNGYHLHKLENLAKDNQIE
jgi:hypothetical protein